MAADKWCKVALHKAGNLARSQSMNMCESDEGDITMIASIVHHSSCIPEEKNKIEVGTLCAIRMRLAQNFRFTIPPSCQVAPSSSASGSTSSVPGRRLKRNHRQKSKVLVGVGVQTMLVSTITHGHLPAHAVVIKRIFGIKEKGDILDIMVEKMEGAKNPSQFGIMLMNATENVS
ncbi:uncharacterized protein LOC134223010 [Armigeres subalbatus]|uniref:uncharacterized protein LOC134223010 n=1 Tax=Armigeres subalbatus TaxID=124917 RepID=UPI002ED32DCC